MIKPVTNYVRSTVATFISVLWSMVVGLKHAFRPDFTVEYPRKEKWDVPDGSRMKLYNNIDDCIGCYKCSRICPTDCIEIETIKAPSDVDLGEASTGNPINFWVPKFDIDMVKCCYCDLCTTVCPTECLVMTKAFEGSAYDRGNLIYSFGNVDSEEMEEINQMLEGDDEEEEEKLGVTKQSIAVETKPEEQAEPAETATRAPEQTETAEQPATPTRTLEPPKPVEEMSLRERVEWRLKKRGKLEDGEPVARMSPDETKDFMAEHGLLENSGGGGSAPQGDTATAPAEPTPTSKPAGTGETEETQTEDAGVSPGEEPDASEETTDDASEEKEVSEITEDQEDTDGWVRNPDNSLRERIKNRLKARGKL